MDKEERCCGACCWFYAEDTDGWGFCAKRKGCVTDYMHCSDLCTDIGDDDTDNFVSRQEMRHYMAVLLQHRRCMHDCNVRAIRKPVDSIERGKAIEFAYKYMKVFSKL